MDGDFSQLEQLLKKVLPVPPEEVQRFKPAMDQANNGEKKVGEETKK